ncbi:MAG TPA: UDP-N-acetylglucosamine 2-epimerase (non-hydrolyzing) [Sumerlaeia bacterium]|nr:UDP-N-acetylglucosamine 2-epimerase (non-hydrolyzing) [Sumerlaeia bacterium]
MVIFGTRPEAIKLAPVIRELRARPRRFRTRICVTAQHREMLDQALATFEIEPDVDLGLMEPNQTLAALTSRVLQGLERVLQLERPACVLVQGDTTTTMASALAAFYHQVPVAHVEAGLRTGNRYSPFPEEINRRLTSHMANWHFAPTQRARENLVAEGIDPARIFLTGNTIVDALLTMRERAAGREFHWGPLSSDVLGDRRVVTITGHRRENFGEGFRAICGAVRRLAQRFPDVAFVYPVHLNPNVRGPVSEMLGALSNVHLIEPLEYLPFIALMERSVLILSDSGGIQEEAPSLGRPVLVMRDTTERPEAVEAGVAKLVGCDERRIVEETARLLTDPNAYAAMTQTENPFGDGTAARQIVDVLDREIPPPD